MQKQFYPKQTKQTNHKCSQCGWGISYSHTFEDMLSGQFRNEKNGSFTATRTTPVRAAGMIPDVAVPAAQSLIWAVVVGLPSVSVSVWMRWEWSAPLFVAACSILASWIASMRRSEFSLVKTEEFSYTASEFSGGEVVAQKSEKPLRMEVVHEISGVRSRMQLLEISDGVGEEKFGSFLKDILAGKSIARKRWVGDGKPFSRDQYDEIIAALLSASIIGPASSGGKKLTRAGTASILHMVREGEI